MRRSLSPMVRRELENLDKDADSRKSAMKALKSYVKELDSKAIPLFLAQVSETKETGSSSGEYTISLYEVLARVHGQKIVPQIDNIMTTIITTLKSSAGSFPLHQACSKVVPAIARYGMDPTTSEEKKRHIIHSLCKPLSDCLLGSDENLSSGAALCLKALVECDNWRYASNDMVNEVCQRVAAALDTHSQINSHMALVMSLAKHNSFAVEAYARLLVRSGIQILKEDVISQKRLSAIHMLNSLMKCLDSKSMFSELSWIIKVMENCQSDQMAYVSGAAFEALQTARKICTERGSKFGKDAVSITGSNFDRRGNIRRRNLWGSGDHSPLTASPESQTVDSFFGRDSLFDSPISTNQASPEMGNGRRSVNRKLWTRDDNGVVNISLKDGIFSEMSNGSVIENSENKKFSDDCGDFPDGFAGFLQETGRNVISRSTTPSPQRSRSHVNVENVKIFTTPRKLIRSLQDPTDEDSDISDKQNRRFRSPSSQFEGTPTSKYKQNGIYMGRDQEINGDGESPIGSEGLCGSSESVSSIDLLADDNLQASPVMVNNIERGSNTARVQKGYWNSTCKRLVVGLIVLLFATISCFLWIVDDGEGYNLVPT